MFRVGSQWYKITVEIIRVLIFKFLFSSDDYIAIGADEEELGSQIEEDILCWAYLCSRMRVFKMRVFKNTDTVKK